MPLVCKEGYYKRGGPHADANVHVNVECLDKRLARLQLLGGRKGEEGEGRSVELGELLLGEGVLQAALDPGDEDNDADGHADAAAKHAHLGNDAL